MSITGGVVSFLLIWWMVLFAVLPLGVRGQWEEGEVADGSEPGAPVSPNLPRKALLTTLVTMVLWGLLYFAIRLGFFSFEMLGL
ncbi:MAG: DUF1467 family protein [Maricaulaceae bacterium]|jgi:predicted secreted protein